MKVYFEGIDPFILLQILVYKTNIRPVSEFSVLCHLIKCYKRVSLTFQLWFVPFHKKENLTSFSLRVILKFWWSCIFDKVTSGKKKKKKFFFILLFVGYLLSKMFHLGYSLLSTWSGFAVAFAIGSLLESLLVEKFTNDTYKLILVVISLLCSTFCFFCVWTFLPYFGSEKHILLCLFTSLVILWFRLLNFYLCLWNQTIKTATPVF